jgi:uncharacterized protein YndB with AHSA1/START domain
MATTNTAKDRTVTHGSFTVERTYPVAPARVFQAFADPAKKRRWYAEEGGGKQVEDFEMDFRVGGGERGRYKILGGPVAGAVITNRTTYLDIVPDERIVFAYSMGFGEQPFSASLATLEFEPAGTGTRLVFTEQGAYFAGGDGPEIRTQGWTQILEQLAKELAR